MTLCRFVLPRAFRVQRPFPSVGIIGDDSISQVDAMTRDARDGPVNAAQRRRRFNANCARRTFSSCVLAPPSLQESNRGEQTLVVFSPRSFFRPRHVPRDSRASRETIIRSFSQVGARARAFGIARFKSQIKPSSRAPRCLNYRSRDVFCLTLHPQRP